jgi:hypothetical protein
MNFLRSTLFNSRSSLSQGSYSPLSVFNVHFKEPVLKRGFSIFGRIKQFIKPDPLYEQKQQVNKAIKESTKGMGLIGMLLRVLLKSVASNSLEHSVHTTQAIKGLALYPEVRRLFGDEIKIVNIIESKDLEHEGVSYAEFHVNIQGSNGHRGKVLAKLHQNHLTDPALVFDEMTIYNDYNQIAFSKLFSETNQPKKFGDEQRVITVEAKEIKE